MAVTRTLTFDTTQSYIRWTGYKPGGQHHGTIGIKSGLITLTDDDPVSAEFIFDMKAIENEDQSGALKETLLSTLKSDKFFDVEKYPEATFSLTKIDHVADADGYFAVTGNLTIRQITNPISFKAKDIYDQQTDVLTVETNTIHVDRTKYGVFFGAKGFISKLEQHVIADNFDVTAHIVAR